MIAGRYSLEAEIGRGGMGTVWRGRDEVLGRVVALKKIGVAPGGVTPDLLRAEREARLGARLNHPHVVAIFDLAEDGEEQWLVMEYVEGTNLAELIAANGSLPPDQAAPILAQVAGALAAAHSHGIVHRDVKPSNILVTAEGQVKLTDFGIARIQADPSLTQTGLVTGSPAYLSPEVASGQQATPASDVWSWGATLFHTLEGRTPYQIGDNLLGALYRIVHEEPPRPTTAGWLTPVLESTMTRDPADRWTASAVQRTLEAGPTVAPPTPVRRLRSVAVGGAAADSQGTQLLPAQGTTTPASAPTPEYTPVVRRRRPWLLIVAAVAVVALLTAIGFAIGLDDTGDEDDPSSTSSQTTGSGNGSSAPANTPTAQAMEAFVRTYIDTAVSDPDAAFDMLTPSYQTESKGLQSYLAFWEPVTDATVGPAEADPDTLVVTYSYSYVRDGKEKKDETHDMQLAFEDGSYLVDGQT